MLIKVKKAGSVFILAESENIKLQDNFISLKDHFSRMLQREI